MSETMWYYAVDGVRNGPVSHTDLCALFAQSKLPLEAQVWAPGMADWAEARSVADFRDIWGKGFMPPAGAALAEPASSARPALAPPGVDSFAVGSATPSRRPRPAPRRGADRRRDGAPQVRPWVRHFARGLDSLLLTVAGAYVFSDSPDMLVFFPNVLLGSLIAHPIQLAMFGTTLGKFVFGISIENEDGEPPSLGQAFSREFRVLVNGLGLNFLIVPLFTMIVAYRHLVTEGVSSWDRDAGTVVRHRPIGPLRWASWVVATVMLGLFISHAAGGIDIHKLAERDTFSGVRRVRAATVVDTYENHPATQPAAAEKRPRPRPKLLTLPTDKPPAAPTIRPKSPSTRPARPNRPPPKVIFKPEPPPGS